MSYKMQRKVVADGRWEGCCGTAELCMMGAGARSANKLNKLKSEKKVGEKIN